MLIHWNSSPFFDGFPGYFIIRQLPVYLYACLAFSWSLFLVDQLDFSKYPSHFSQSERNKKEFKADMLAKQPKRNRFDPKQLQQQLWKSEV